MTPEQIASFHELGWLRLERVLDPPHVARLLRWAGELQTWADAGQPGLHHHEQTGAGPAVARSELFIDDHPELAAFIRSGVAPELVGRLLGEPAVLFKEKVNYKHPGGAGFAPHQDATAYRFVDHHVSVMVPVDPSTVASGCLYFAPGHDRGQLPTDERGRITEEVVAALDWRAVEAQPGDLVVFDSYTPHHSDTNHTDRSRRALYLTYNAASLGDLRTTYYRDKLAEFHREGDTFGDERVRMSISDDFLGRPAPVPR